jgi:hypothetical protein
MATLFSRDSYLHLLQPNSYLTPFLVSKAALTNGRILLDDSFDT